MLLIRNTYCTTTVLYCIHLFRYGTQWEQGFVTTYKPEDLPVLRNLLSQQPEPITQAGLHPTADQIELYAYHLPNSTLSNLMVCAGTKKYYH